MNKSPCKNCEFICDDGIACCAGPCMGIPWSEPCSFQNDLTDEIEMPEECFVLEDMKETVCDVFYNLSELVEEWGNPVLQRKCEELEMWLDFLCRIIERKY